MRSHFYLMAKYGLFSKPKEIIDRYSFLKAKGNNKITKMKNIRKLNIPKLKTLSLRKFILL